MSSPTVARVQTEQASHWYYPDGRACYELPKKDGSGMKIPTLADARKLNLLPGVSTILNVLHKEALVQWKIEQAVLASTTSPKLAGETLDDYIHRILHVEKVQDEEAQAARDKGNEIHGAFNDLANNRPIAPELAPWIMPAWRTTLEKFGMVKESETILIGDGYGGRADLITDVTGTAEVIVDFKSAKTIPREPWDEHRLQLSAYAAARHRQHSKTGLIIPIRVANVYLSTVHWGVFAIFEHQNWQYTYTEGFEPLLKVWQWMKDYRPKQ